MFYSMSDNILFYEIIEFIFCLDISAMELFAASNVNAEPFTVIKKLKQGLSRTLDIVEEDLF